MQTSIIKGTSCTDNGMQRAETSNNQNIQLFTLNTFIYTDIS